LVGAARLDWYPPQAPTVQPLCRATAMRPVFEANDLQAMVGTLGKIIWQSSW
jgi:hypothetical protein